MPRPDVANHMRTDKVSEVDVPPRTIHYIAGLSVAFLSLPCNRSKDSITDNIIAQYAYIVSVIRLVRLLQV